MIGISLALSLGNPVLSGGGWSPDELGDDLLAWWDASSGVSLSGSSVTAWEDRRAGYSVTQSTDGSRPSYSPTGFNGAPGITFDGAADCLEMASQPFGSGAIDLEVWAVVQQDALIADATERTLLSFGGDLPPAQVRVARAVSGGANRGIARIGDGASTVYSIATGDFSGRSLLRTRITPTATYASINGDAAVSSAIVPSISENRTRIGASANVAANTFWSGKISDVIVTQPLSDGQAASLRAFLLSRRRP